MSIKSSWLLFTLFWSTAALADGPHVSAAACQPETRPQSVMDAWTALKRDPNSLEIRLRLADALIDQGCYNDAVPILEAGLAERPRSSELQSRLRAARSMLNEEHFFVGLGNAQENAKLQHDLLRCAKLADVSACDDALRSKPGDPQLTVAKGDALLHGGRPAEALLIYRHAAELLPGDAGIQAKLATAESQRQTLVSQCEENAGEAAVAACKGALLQGAPDEFALLKRRGILLQSMDRAEQALDAFIAANILKQDDKSVASAIIALTDSTGRKDALALAARGSALLALGRPMQSLPVLRQAQTLAPALPGVKTQLALAEQAARIETKRQARTVITKSSATPTHSNEVASAGATAQAALGSGAGVAATIHYSNDAVAGQTN